MRKRGSRQGQDRYRTGYLKMKSVLFDRATELPACPMLFDDLRTLLDTRRELGVLHLEIVNLDMVESLYGWQTFDRVVGRVADCLRESIGVELPEGALLAVNGVAGDRFVAFMPGDDKGNEPRPAYLADVAARVCRRLEDELEHDDLAGLGPRLCFRAGHALLSENPFFRFERCVYASVERARATHDRREKRRELSWGEELRGIIQRCAVDAVVQPVVELRTREVLGHEAFVRGPRDTMFETPRAMFALSSRVGVSAELDRLCCETALRASVGLEGRGKLFVNLLGANFDTAWDRDSLMPLVRELGLDPSDLVVEISEREAESDPGPFVSRLKRVKDDGFSLAVDDLGTGRAGLAAVEDVRPDYLKLDNSMVRDIDRSIGRQDVLRTLVDLAGRIDASVIAEGIETEAEVATLVSEGARYGQGYLYARPCLPGTGAGTGTGGD